MEPETQIHIGLLQECPEIGNTIGKCNYEDIYDIKLLKENAEIIIKIEDKLRNIK